MQGFRGADRMAFSSMRSMTRLAMMGERGDPIATPSICSKNWLWNLKKVKSRQRSARDTICSNGIEVLSSCVPHLPYVVLFIHDDCDFAFVCWKDHNVLVTPEFLDGVALPVG